MPSESPLTPRKNIKDIWQYVAICSVIPNDHSATPMFTDMVRVVVAIDRVGKARERRGLSDDPRDPKEVHVQEGIHPHPGPNRPKLARSSFLVRLMIGFISVMLPSGINADKSFPNESNLCSGPWLCEESRRQANLPMLEANENVHKN